MESPLHAWTVAEGEVLPLVVRWELSAPSSPPAIREKTNFKEKTTFAHLPRGQLEGRHFDEHNLSQASYVKINNGKLSADIFEIESFQTF